MVPETSGDKHVLAEYGLQPLVFLNPLFANSVPEMMLLNFVQEG